MFCGQTKKVKKDFYVDFNEVVMFRLVTAFLKVLFLTFAFEKGLEMNRFFEI